MCMNDYKNAHIESLYENDLKDIRNKLTQNDMFCEKMVVIRM